MYGAFNVQALFVTCSFVAEIKINEQLKSPQPVEFEHVVNGRALGATKDGAVTKTFDPNSLVCLFRGYSLFFLNFKLNAPEDVKERFRKIVEEFIAWMNEKGHVETAPIPNLRSIDPRTSSLATQAGTILHKAVLHSERSRKVVEDMRNGEPLYMVSRSRAGKLWFIYHAGKEYDDFGPVSVPLGVSDIVKAGWLLDCDFVKCNGRWQISAVRSLLPI
ncbi:MAG: hypothetical protein K2X77_33810 [Candidatus Obscuribacterales bacterium]|nr:hypothetical protein [Candidatus Obscuribacterales bacterium]